MPTEIPQRMRFSFPTVGPRNPSQDLVRREKLAGKRLETPAFPEKSSDIGRETSRPWPSRWKELALWPSRLGRAVRPPPATTDQIVHSAPNDEYRTEARLQDLLQGQKGIRSPPSSQRTAAASIARCHPACGWH